MIPRYDTPPRRGQSYRRRPGVYAILWREGRLLVTHQEAPTPEFQLPGGGIDPGESPIRALHREVMEETGFTIGPPRHLGYFRRFVFMPEYDLFAAKLCAIFLARPILRRGPPTEPGHSAHWMRPQEALDRLANPGDRAFVAQMMAWGIWADKR